MNNDITERVQRLPKWVRRHIDRLERNLEDARQQIATMTSGPSGSRVVIRDVVGGEDQPLEEDVWLRFVFDPDDYEAYLDVSLDDHPVYGSGIQVRAGRSLVIHPIVTNVVHIRPEMRTDRADVASGESEGE